MIRIIADPTVGVKIEKTNFDNSIQKSVNVLFGDKRSKIRIAMGEYREFRKSKRSKNTTDDFGYCHIFYNEQDEFEAIEIFPEATVQMETKNADEKEKSYSIVFPTDSGIIKTLFPNCEEAQGYYTDNNLSVSITAPGKKSDSILFAVKGYF